MNIYEFKKILTRKSCTITVQGLINLQLKIEHFEMKINYDDITIADSNKQLLGINKHQIMNIKSNSDGSIEIWLDQLLKIHISSK